VWFLWVWAHLVLGRRTLLVAIASFAALALAVAALRIPADLEFGRAALAIGDGGKAYEEATALVDARNPAAARRWEEALAHFTSAAGILADQSEARARALRRNALRLAGDVAVVGLHDPARARPLLEAHLASLEASNPLDPDPEEARFVSRIHLGRVAAWEGKLDEARALHQASAVTAAGPEAHGGSGALRRENRRLLRATIDARDPVKPDAARAVLSELATLRTEGPGWDEIRREARWELAQLDAAKR
jgi:hypothetical protein